MDWVLIIRFPLLEFIAVHESACGLSDRYCAATECPLLGGDLNRSTQHFILDGKDQLKADKSVISWWYEGGRENHLVG
jgi:hypothetical protein